MATCFCSALASLAAPATEGSKGTRIRTAIRPSKSPVAKWRSSSDDAPNVPHLKPCCFSVSHMISNFPWFIANT